MNKLLFYKIDKTILTITVITLSIILFKPFINTIVIAYMSAYLLTPYFRFINNKIKNKTWSITIMMILLVLLIVLPTVILSIFIYQEIISFNTGEVFGYSGFSLNDYLTNTANQITAATPFNISSTDLSSSIYNIITSLPQFLFKNAVNIGNQLLIVLTNIIVYLLIVPIIVLNKKYVDEIITSLIPLSDTEFKKNLLKNINELFSLILKGTVLTGVIQSLISYLYFLLLDIPNSLLLAFFVFLSSLIPNASLIIYMLISIFYIINNNILMSILNLVFFALIISSVDNVVRPLITRKNVRINPIIMIFAILGGLSYFGFLGIFYGPIILLIIIEFIRFTISTNNE